MRQDAVATEEYPLSSQQGAVHLQAMGGRGSAGLAIAFLLEGPSAGIDATALRTALEREVDRHEVLRTRYRSVEGLRYPVQQVHASLTPAWRSMDAAVSEEVLLEAACALIDAKEGPVLAGVVSEGKGRLRWALAASRLGLDAASLQMLASRCVRLAQGEAGDGEQEPLQYADYAAWQQELFSTALGEDGAQFWSARLSARKDAPRLPFLRSTPAAAEACSAEVDLSAGEALVRLAASAGTDAPWAVLACWLAFMSRLTASERLSFTLAADQRSPETESALGNYEQAQPVQAQVDEGLSVIEGISALEAQWRDYGEWAECLDVPRLHEQTGERESVFSPWVFQQLRLQALPAGWAWRAWDVPSPAARLVCQCVEEAGRWRLRWLSQGHCAAQTLSVFARQFAHALAAAAAEPSLRWRDLPLMGSAQRAEVLAMAGPSADERAGPSVGGLHRLVEAAALRHPDRKAVAGDGGSLSYAELDRRATVLAQALRAGGVGQDDIVGIIIGRSVHAITAMLAVLKAGAAYVPIDPEYPKERVAFVLADCGARALLVLAADRPSLSSVAAQTPVFVADELPPGGKAAPGVSVARDALAYLIYTSGSTGRPKGVMVTHGNVVASTLARCAYYVEPVRDYLLLSSFSFDSSVAGIFWTLAQGGTLHIPRQDEYQQPDRLGRLLVEEGISHVLALPSFYEQIVEHAPDLGSLRCAIVAGEACQAGVVVKHRSRAPQAALVNEYGPTEGTVWSNAFRLAPDYPVQDGVPIGRPIPGARAYVLDHRLDLCAVGVMGELFIGGPGVTRGYLDRPALTAQRYVADPLGRGERLYRTGDLARYRPDGEIDCLGRADDQVKLRGHRVELGEIERCLARHTDVREAVAVFREDPSTGGRILAGVTLRESTADPAHVCDAVLAHLRQRLPAVMVPSGLAVLEAMPHLPNGKIDRTALAERIEARRRPPHVEPVSEVEKALAGIWEAVLKTDRVGLDDDFFELGGHSLLATQVVARVRQRLSVELPVGDVFAASRLRELAARVESGTQELDRELDLLEKISGDVSQA